MNADRHNRSAAEPEAQPEMANGKWPAKLLLNLRANFQEVAQIGLVTQRMRGEIAAISYDQRSSVFICGSIFLFRVKPV